MAQFQPEKITRENILQAIEEIDREKPELISSTKFDLIYNRKSYPPKEVMRIAHKYATGEHLWEYGGGYQTNRYFEKFGFEIKEKEKNMKKEKYTWVPFFKELSVILLKYENRQNELIKILNQAGITDGFTDKDENGDIPLNEIDPFTFYAYFMKYGINKKIEAFSKIKSILNIKADIPSDDSGIPSAQPFSVWLFRYKKNRDSRSIPTLWKLFNKIHNNEDISREFDFVLLDKEVFPGIQQAKLSQYIYWPFPDKFLPVDTQTRPYLKKRGIKNEYSSYKEYQSLLTEAKNTLNLSFYEISYEAWYETQHTFEINTRNFEDSYAKYLDGIINTDWLSDAESYKFRFGRWMNNNIEFENQNDDEVLELCMESQKQVYYSNSSAKGVNFILSDLRFNDSFIYKDTIKSIRQIHEYGIDEEKDLSQDIHTSLPKFTIWAANLIPDQFRAFPNTALFKSLEYLYNLKKYYKKGWKSFVFVQKILWDLDKLLKDKEEKLKPILKNKLGYDEIREVDWIWIVQDFLLFIEAEILNEDKILKDELVNRIQEIEDTQILDIYFNTLAQTIDHLNLKRIDKSVVYSLPKGYKGIPFTINSRYTLRLRRKNNAYFLWMMFPNDKKEIVNSNLEELTTGSFDQQTGESESDVPGYINFKLSPQTEISNEILNLFFECIQKEYNRGHNASQKEKNNPFIYDMAVDKSFRGEIYQEAFNTVPLIVVEEEPFDYGKRNYYWINANPKHWRITSFKEGQEQTYTTHNEKNNKRRIYKYMQELKPGDLIIGYESSPINKVVACFEVNKGVYDDDDEGEVFSFWLKEFFPLQPTWWELFDDPVLANCEVYRNNQGSLFKLTKTEFETITRYALGVEKQFEKYTIKEIDNDVFIEKDRIETILKLLAYKKNILLQGPPGTGKTFIAKRLAYTYLKEKNDDRIEMIQFHQSYAYEDFIQGFRPKENGGFELKNGVFYEFCKKAQRNANHPHFFIIDEINRGNLSKIFGELMMLIEHDKRGEKFAIPLTYSQIGDDKFYIPNNVFIIGTMNTADRSLAIVDYALRRRFSFINIVPEFNGKFESYLKDKDVPKKIIDQIKNKLKSLNDTIEKDNDLGWGYKLGHSYFCNIPDKPDDAWYNLIIENEIKPLLKEYWFDDIEKANKLVENLYI